MSGRRLRVGVDAGLLALSPRSGHGKVWRRVLAILGREVRLVPIEGGRRRFPRRKPDVVLADGHTDLPEHDGTPLVVQVHEAAWFRTELRAVLDPAFVAHIAPRTERSVRIATRIITPSETARRDVIDTYGLDPSRVVAAHHGADPVFRPEAANRDVSDLVGSGPYVLFAAMIHPRKNLAAVRDAIDELAREGLPHHLVIVGGPATDRPDSRDLEAAAVAALPHAPGRVHRIVDPDEETLAALMARADAFCLPSLYEGFGLTVLEAMACGTAPVVSDRGALPEIVAEAGVVVAPEAGAVATALRRLLADEPGRKRLEAAAVRRAGKFSWDATAERWLGALVEAAAAPAPGDAP